jgi:hypothetical protein
MTTEHYLYDGIPVISLIFQYQSQDLSSNIVPSKSQPFFSFLSGTNTFCQVEQNVLNTAN